MSTDSTTRLGSRENFFNSDSEAYDDEPESRDHGDHAGVNRNKWVAKKILLGAPGTRHLCPNCWRELDVAADLTEPRHYVPPSEVVTDERLVVDETNFLAPGDKSGDSESEGDSARGDEGDHTDADADVDETIGLSDLDFSVLASLETELWYADHRRHRRCPNCAQIAFGGVIADRPADEFRELVDEVLAAIGRLPSGRRRKLLDGAMSRKRKGWSDVANVEALVREIRTGTR